MKVVILAGGFGSRLSEHTNKIPKPMVKIGNKPIIEHIMHIYMKYGYNEFIFALGYKKEKFRKYFKNKNYNIKFVDTGLTTMTGGRLKRLKKYLNDETFMMTYGDGLANVNIKKLVSFHNRKKKTVTITAVRPPARFGALKLSGNLVTSFKEKSKMDEGWINGGFFVINTVFLNIIKNDKVFLEKKPLENICKKKQLTAYKHKGFWQCMDTKRDRDKLLEFYKKDYFPWL